MSGASPYRIERLDPARHRREAFYCEAPELTEFIQKRARREMDARASACFVLVAETDPGRIVGFYTLSQTSVSLHKLPETLVKKLPGYPEFGATLIGRLARDREWLGKGIGSLLLIDALRRSVRLSGEAGAVVVVTDPKNAKAQNFYQGFGFQALDHRRLFIPMKDLIKREDTGWAA
jgi:GNAT superfamily N-acetyltransferase